MVTVAKGVRIVPQGEEWVVERLGKFRGNLMPGLHILIPYIDRVAYKVPTKDIILDIPQQEVITKDNAVLITNAIAFVKVTDTRNAVYGVSNYEVAVSNVIQTTLRSILGEMELDLSRLQVEQFDVSLGVGKVKLVFSDKAVHGKVNCAIGETLLLLPPGVEAKISVKGGITAVNMPDGFTHSGDVYTSSGYNNPSAIRIDIEVDQAIGNVRVEYQK